MVHDSAHIGMRKKHDPLEELYEPTPNTNNHLTPGYMMLYNTVDANQMTISQQI